MTREFLRESTSKYMYVGDLARKRQFGKFAQVLNQGGADRTITKCGEQEGTKGQ